MTKDEWIKGKAYELWDKGCGNNIKSLIEAIELGIQYSNKHKFELQSMDKGWLVINSRNREVVATIWEGEISKKQAKNAAEAIVKAFEDNVDE